MKKLSFFLFMLCMALSVPACKDKQKQVNVDNGTIVAKVGDKVITKDQFNATVEKSMKRYRALGKNGHPAMENRIKNNILRKMTDNLLFEQKAEQLGLVVTEEQINKKFEEQKNRFGDEKAFEEYLARTSNVQDELKKDIRINLLREMVTNKMNEPVNVTDDDIKKYYDANSDRYVEPEEVHARHILIRVDKSKYTAAIPADLSSEERAKAEDEALVKAKKEAMDKINNVQKLLKEPNADFGKIAMEYSEGPTAPKGGDLGFFSRKRMVKEFSDVVFNLKDGEISDVVETRYGLHIIQAIEHKAAVRKTFDEVKDGIKNSIENRQKGENRRDTIRRLKEEFKVEILIDLPKDNNIPDLEEFKNKYRRKIPPHEHRK